MQKLAEKNICFADMVTLNSVIMISDGRDEQSSSNWARNQKSLATLVLIAGHLHNFAMGKIRYGGGCLLKIPLSAWLLNV